MICERCPVYLHESRLSASLQGTGIHCVHTLPPRTLPAQLTDQFIQVCAMTLLQCTTAWLATCTAHTVDADPLLTRLCLGCSSSRQHDAQHLLGGTTLATWDSSLRATAAPLSSVFFPLQPLKFLWLLAPPVHQSGRSLRICQKFVSCHK